MHHHSKRGLAAQALETKADSDDTDPLKAIEALGNTINGKFADIAKEMKAMADKVDVELVKRNRPGAENKSEGDEVEAKAFTTFLRKGAPALTVDEVKSLRVADDTSGGYLAPAEFSAEIDKNVVQFSPVRLAARVGQTSAGSVIIPRRTGKPTGYWVGETETRTETGSTYGQAEIPVDEIACYVDVSNKLLEDAAVDINGEVAFDLAEEFGRLEGAAFVGGDGVKKPLGFMSDANVGYTAGGHASGILPEGMIDLFYALAPFYRQRATWMMNGSTLAAIRKITDGQGQYIWQPGLTAGQPETILGRPVVEAVDMPDVAANAYPIVFGDFATAYRIYDRVGMSILRDPYTQATSGLTRFHARKRVGGRIVRTEALRKLKIATS